MKLEIVYICFWVLDIVKVMVIREIRLIVRESYNLVLSRKRSVKVVSLRVRMIWMSCWGLIFVILVYFIMMVILVVS